QGNLPREFSVAVEGKDPPRRADDAGLVAQMLILKMAELPRLKSIEEALSGAVPSAPPAATPSRARGDSQGPRILSIVPVEPERESAPSSAPLPGSKAALTRFHDLLDARRRVASAQASLAESIDVGEEEMVFRFGIDKAAA